MENAGQLAGMDERSKELHYLTEHYRDLQGLVMAPAWAAFAVLEAWIGKIRPEGGLWIAVMIGASLGWLAVKWAVWARDWYERRYGVVWGTDAVEEPGEILSLLHGENESVAAKRRDRKRRRWIAAISMTLAFLLPGFWLHGASGPVGAESLLLSLAPAYFLGPLILEPAGGSPLAMWRRGVYAAATLVLLGGDLLYLDGRVNDVWGMTLVGGVMLLVCLQDHWLFTRLLKGGAQARGGCDE